MIRSINVFVLGVSLASACVLAQAPEKPGAPVQSAAVVQADSAGAAAPAADQPAFKPEEIEQLVAPIALYPDSLLSQILMASTYPLEVVEADRWVKANASLKGDALAAELERRPWDPSVRSLVSFPSVLAMMSENLSTTVKIGDAFIGQQQDVMGAIQRLRSKAQAQGTLASTQQQTVNTVTQEGTQVIVIQSASPEIVYVPQYSPTVVYGAWPYPAYPPYPYYPPGYVASNVVSFGVGVAVGVAWGYAWGGCNWHHGDIDIDINRNYNRNTTINRNNFEHRTMNGNFQHNPAHRQGVAYRNQASAQRVGASNSMARTSQARSEFRGHANTGAAPFGGGNAGGATRPGFQPGGAPGANQQTPRNQGAARSPGQDRSPSQLPARSTSGGASGSRGSAFSGGSGSSDRAASNRGASSRSASPSRSAGGGGGGSRGGGGRR
jgi:hypothetical protein